MTNLIGRGGYGELKSTRYFDDSLATIEFEKDNNLFEITISCKDKIQEVKNDGN